MRYRTAFYTYCTFFSEDDDDYSDDDDMSWKVENNALLTCEIELYSSRKCGAVSGKTDSKSVELVLQQTSI